MSCEKIQKNFISNPWNPAILFKCMTNKLGFFYIYINLVRSCYKWFKEIILELSCFIDLKHSLWLRIKLFFFATRKMLLREGYEMFHVGLPTLQRTFTIMELIWCKYPHRYYLKLGSHIALQRFRILVDGLSKKTEA